MKGTVMPYIDPNDYSELSDDSLMLQAAVDAAALSGQSVLIPRINKRTGKDEWVLQRAIKLHSGSTVILDSCRLRLADGVFDSIFKNDFAHTREAGLICNRQYDVRIIGQGSAVLDGGRHNGLTERNDRDSDNPKFDHCALENTLVHLQNCERLVIENLRIENPRYWGMTFHYCAYGRISNIQFMSSGACPNADGIDLRMGCRDFIIENISGYTQDDSIALTCLNDDIAHVQGMDGDIHGIMIRNVSTCTRCANIRLLNHYGHKLYNVIIQNVQSSVEKDPAAPDANDYLLQLPDALKLEPAVEPVYWSTFENRARRAHVCVKIGENGYFAQGGNGANLGDTFNIRVQNVQTDAHMGISLARTLCDSSFDGIQMFGRSAIGVYFGKGEFEDLQFSGIGFARNVRYHDADLKPRTGTYGYDTPAAVVFGGSNVRNASFTNISTHPCGGDAFSGHGNVDLYVQNVTLRHPDAKLISGAGISIKQ